MQDITIHISVKSYQEVFFYISKWLHCMDKKVKCIHVFYQNQGST